MNTRGLNIPFVSFGNVTSDNLFDAKEQPLFDFYEAAGKAKRYRKALDIGANIGVHSILMAWQGWAVRAFEPDADHMAMLRGNLLIHGLLDKVTQTLAAVSDHNGTETFVRVKGNTTGSHLKGDKNPYGELDEFQVPVVDCRLLFQWADFAKIDCEGHEARLLKTITPEIKCEFMVEVGTAKNAQEIWEVCYSQGRGMWSQKRGWEPCGSIWDMPKHHSEGSLFIGRERPFQ